MCHRFFGQDRGNCLMHGFLVLQHRSSTLSASFLKAIRRLPKSPRQWPSRYLPDFAQQTWTAKETERSRSLDSIAGIHFSAARLELLRSYPDGLKGSGSATATSNYEGIWLQTVARMYGTVPRLIYMGIEPGDTILATRGCAYHFRCHCNRRGEVT